MKKKRPKAIKTKKVTRFKGETQMNKENDNALKKIRAFKGMFG